MFLMFNFAKKRKSEKVPETLEEVLAVFESLEEKIKELSGRIEEIKKSKSGFFQKLGLIRFNPYKGMGGDQSFSLAMLDGENNGFIVTSLSGRSGNRIFAKPINNGKSSYQLSEEEGQALEKAKNSLINKSDLSNG